MEEQTVYDVIVVGAGIQGSATAYFLRKHHQKSTVLLEQFPLPHTRGSSHGHSRITRMAYGGMDHYTEMMPESYSIIKTLERATGKQLFINNGFLTIGKRDSLFLKGTVESLQRTKFPHRVLTLEQGKQEFPFVTPSDDMMSVYDQTGGILLADKMLSAFQDEYVKYGGVIKDNKKVLQINPGRVVTVETSNGLYKGRSLVLTPGPWASSLLNPLGIQLPLQPRKVLVCYWKQDPNKFNINASSCPTFYIETDIGAAYGIPALEYSGLVKVCLGNGVAIDPDSRDSVDASHLQEEIKSVISKHFPTLSPTPSISETCIYTMTPDIDIILDKHSKWNNIVFAAGFSGHGFKLAPVIGKLLAEMATNTPTSYSIKPFSKDRFSKIAKL